MRYESYLASGCFALAMLSACADMPQPASPSDAKMSAPNETPAREEMKSAEVMVVQSAPGSAGESASRTLALSMDVATEEPVAGNRPSLDAPPPPPPPPPQATSLQGLALGVHGGQAPPPRPVAPHGPPAPGPARPASAPVANPTGAAPRHDAGEAVALRGPMLVYTAQVTMAVFEVNASLARVEAIGRDMGGFLAKRDDRSITIRVPVARFDEAVKRIESVGDMLHRNVSAEDVTEEFRDLDVRLKSARAVQERLTQLLAKAVKVEESVLIERELDRVTGEIERIEGRIKFLRDRASLSTITVTFDAKHKETVGSEVRLPGRWLQELGLRRLLGI